MPELPSGAVTFLFTDIEGSTRLVKQLRDRYGEVLGEHQRLLREAFAAHGGHEVDTQGDSFFVAFGRARDALLAAAEAQRSLANHPWPEGVRIRVRMGLHTGQAVASEGRYTGLAVHRAARIGAAGHGGQILVSQATQTLVEDEEEQLGVSLRDLGEQRLKDLDRPVRLYQADVEGLPSEFPPLKGSDEPGREPPVPLWRRPVVLAAGALLAGVAVAVAVALVVLGDDPAPVTVRPNEVAILDPETTRVVGVVAVGSRPGPITFGAGSIWVGNLDDYTVTRIDPGTRTALKAIGLDDRTPTGLAFGGGAVWVAHGLLGELTRIDPQFESTAPPIEVAGPAFGVPYGSVAFGFASVWAAFGDGTLARVDPRTQRVVEKTRAGPLPSGVAVDPGAVWVANAGDSTVRRYNPETFTEAAIRPYTVGRRPLGIATGDAVWVANEADDSVTRIDPSAGAVRQIDVGDGPTAVAVGEEAVWVANTAAGTLSRIDSATLDVETIAIGNAPAGIVVAEGYVWVTVQAP